LVILNDPAKTLSLQLLALQEGRFVGTICHQAVQLRYLTAPKPLNKFSIEGTWNLVSFSNFS